MNNIQGSNRRCGGQGDILSGVLTIFAYWAHKAAATAAAAAEAIDVASDDGDLNSSSMLAAYAASTLVRETSKKTFERLHRSMLTTDILNDLATQFYFLFDS
jgi:ATP-dependent NAD(P)H-hydrate dehydratase